MTRTPRDVDVLEQAGFLLLAGQFAVFGALWNAHGFDSASNGFPIFVMATGLFVAGQRKLAARPLTRGAARWITASRATALAMLALGTVAVAVYRLVPEAAPAPDLAVRSLFALLWIMIALKGAAMGKLKPGSAIGLCVSWTKQSRLAWERGHRTLGRILFWGGLIGLATSFVLPPFASIGMWFATVLLAMTAALIESRRAWQLDPERSGRHPA